MDLDDTMHVRIPPVIDELIIRQFFHIYSIEHIIRKIERWICLSCRIWYNLFPPWQGLGDACFN